MTITIELRQRVLYSMFSAVLTPKQIAILDGKLKLPQKLWPKTRVQIDAFFKGYNEAKKKELCRVNGHLSAHCIPRCKTLEEADAVLLQLKYALSLWALFLKGFCIDMEALDRSVHEAFVIPHVISKIWVETGQNPLPITWVDKLHALVAEGSKLDSNIVTYAVTNAVNEYLEAEASQIADDLKVAQQLQYAEYARVAH
jgi:hypothetical protein